jgi:hypothetical protein
MEIGQLFDKASIEKLEEKNRILHEENERLKELNQRLQAEYERVTEDIKQNKSPCGCDQRSFKRVKRIPSVDEAARIYDDSFKTTESKDAERATKEDAIKEIVFNMLRQVVQIDIKETSDKKRIPGSVMAILREKAEEITNELLEIKEIGVHQVKQILHDESRLHSKKNIDIVAASPGRFTRLVKILQAKRSTDPYFDMLRRTVSDILHLNLPAIWREMEGIITADESLEYAAEQANEYCRQLLDPYKLDSEVEETNSIISLQEIVRECMNNPAALPTNAKNYHKLISAVTKIRMMHLAETIKSQIDFDQIKKETMHLREVIDAHTQYTEDGHTVFTIGEPNEEQFYTGNDIYDPYAIKLDGIEIRQPKEEISIARKYMVKDTDGKDFDTSKIYDFVGLRIHLTERDSVTNADMPDEENNDELNPLKKIEKKKPPIERATKKILSFLCAMFGTDNPASRLRYTYDSGESIHGFSTGKHRAFHVTFRYRHQCKNNGLNGNGYPLMKTVYVEVQVVVHMDREEKREDQKKYDKKKNMKIQNITGIDRTFSTWLSDLADILEDDDELVSAALEEKNTYRYTDKEIVARILFEAITKRENRKVLKELMALDRQRRKFIRVAREYVDYQPLARKHRKKIGLQTSSGPTLINKLAKKALKILEKISDDYQ